MTDTNIASGGSELCEFDWILLLHLDIIAFTSWCVAVQLILFVNSFIKVLIHTLVFFFSLKK